MRYAVDDSVVKPYFPLERVVDAAFDCAQRLFGLRFVARPEIVAYHPDVKVYEVHGRDDRLVGVFLHDNFARPTKRGGAWMSAYRLQSRIAGDVLPIIVNNNNFAKGAPGEPTLLSLDDALTLFHEFGHGLHGLLSQVTFESLSGTQVLRDFVELPSQIFENWLLEPQVLKRHARHVDTGEPMPDDLIERLEQARRFNQGFETVEYTACALVDMALHAQADPAGVDITAVRARRTGAPRHAARNRDASSTAALPASVREFKLRGRLLRLHVGRSARCRRLRRVPRGRQSVRPGGGGAPAALCLLGRQHARAGRRVPCVSRSRSEGRADA